MSEDKIHQYFKRKTSDWSILGFLDECNLEPFDQKIQYYITNLEAIIKLKAGCKCKKAQQLLEQYKQGGRPDRQLARKWERDRKSNNTNRSPTVNIYNPKFTGNPLVSNSGSINGWNSVHTLNQKNDKEGNHKSLTSKESESSSEHLPCSDDDESDDKTSKVWNLQSAAVATGTATALQYFGETERIYNDQATNIQRKRKLLAREEDAETEHEILVNGDLNEKNGDLVTGLETRTNQDKEKNIDDIKVEFKKKYMNLSNDKKWKLPSGKYVEDVIYEYGKKLPYESPVHSFVIDTSKAAIMNLFSGEDQDHITTHNILPDPEIDDKLMEYLFKYRKVQPQEMREVINAGIKISSYDSKKHFNYHYIHQVFSQLLPRYELRSSDFTTSHLEGWFTSNIWSVIVDACLVDLETVEFIRGESCSRASGQRKNSGRESSETRMLIGRKCDGIVRELASPEEFAVSEEGRDWTGEDGTKYLDDGGLKIPKIMRDMLRQKLKKDGVNVVRSRKTEIVGFLHSAQRLQTLAMDTPAGYMCRLRRYPSTKVPPTLAEVDDLIEMIHQVLIGKLRIARSLGSSHVQLTSTQELKERLKKRSLTLQAQDNYDFPDTQRTPRKNRKKRFTV